LIFRGHASSKWCAGDLREVENWMGRFNGNRELPPGEVLEVHSADGELAGVVRLVRVVFAVIVVSVVIIGGGWSGSVFVAEAEITAQT
jgi:hypothetical protein